MPRRFGVQRLRPTGRGVRKPDIEEETDDAPKETALSSSSTLDACGSKKDRGTCSAPSATLGERSAMAVDVAGRGRGRDDRRGEEPTGRDETLVAANVLGHEEETAAMGETRRLRIEVAGKPPSCEGNLMHHPNYPFQAQTSATRASEMHRRSSGWTGLP